MTEICEEMHRVSERSPKKYISRLLFLAGVNGLLSTKQREKYRHLTIPCISTQYNVSHMNPQILNNLKIYFDSKLSKLPELCYACLPMYAISPHKEIQDELTKLTHKGDLSLCLLGFIISQLISIRLVKKFAREYHQKKFYFVTKGGLEVLIYVMMRPDIVDNMTKQQFKKMLSLFANGDVDTCIHCDDVKLREQLTCECRKITLEISTFFSNNNFAKKFIKSHIAKMAKKNGDSKTSSYFPSIRQSLRLVPVGPFLKFVEFFGPASSVYSSYNYLNILNIQKIRVCFELIRLCIPFQDIDSKKYIKAELFDLSVCRGKICKEHFIPLMFSVRSFMASLSKVGLSNLIDIRVLHIYRIMIMYLM